MFLYQCFLKTGCSGKMSLQVLPFSATEVWCSWVRSSLCIEKSGEDRLENEKNLPGVLEIKEKKPPNGKPQLKSLH